MTTCRVAKMSDKSQRTGDGTSGLRRKKSFQGRQYRRRTKPISEQYKADLSKILGLTVKNNCGFACNEATGNIAFPAGCVIVVRQVRKNKEFHIFNPGHKSLTCIQISLDGQYIVTGESGHLPCMRVFSVTEKCQLASFQSHKFGISCVAFSPNSQYIISIGYQHDNVINVWNWRKNALAATNKVSIKVRAVAFSEDSSRFVTVGNRHVKFWYIEQSKGLPDTETVPLKGRSGLLGSVRNQLFCDVACGVGGDGAYTYTLSRSAMLCQFNEKRTLANSLQLQASTAFCMSVVNGMIVCGCGEGKVLLYTSSDLQLLSSFVSSDLDSGLHDLVAVSMDSNNMWVHCIHKDHTMKVWDLLDFERPLEHSSSSFHSDCVWDIKGLPQSETENSSFYTCSNDATVKLWDLKDEICELRNNIAVDSGDAVSTPSNPKTGKVGIRSLCVSRDANFLAVGDRNGVIHIYRTEACEHKRLKQVEMHSGDILSLAFNPSNGMLASASRDRCIYILDSNHEPTYTINDHSAAVTAVEFIHLNNKFRLISCGVDKSLYFCTVNDVDGRVEIVRDQHIVEKHAMHDMKIVKDSVLVACGANLREYDIDTGKSQRCLRGSESLATIIRVTTNTENTIISISCADKFVYLLNYLSGDCLLELGGHSEICTALTFVNTTSDTTLVTASADSCIFTWKLTRCAKIDDNVLSFQAQLSPHAENELEDETSTPSDAVNQTAFFGDPVLNGTLIGDTPEDVPMDEDEVEESEMSNVGKDKMDLDASLPTWLTGNKDKVVKTKKPTGKWASRFQDDVVLLDTPRTVMEWDDIDEDDSNTEDVTEESDEEREDDENCQTIETVQHEPDNNENDDQQATTAVDLDVVVSEDDAGNGKTESRSCEIQEHAAHPQDDISATLSSDYASAIDESDKENQSPSKNDGTATKKFKSEIVITMNGNTDTTDVISSDAQVENENPKITDCTKGDMPNELTENTTINQDPECKVTAAKNDGSSPANIPPAFADFLNNLTKKKPRPVPGSLPVRSSYNFKGPNRTRSASDTASLILSSVNVPPTKRDSAPVLDHRDGAVNSDASTSSDECQEAVDNLMNAYEHAESIYNRVSGENGDVDIHMLLSNTFSSLKGRIDQLQLKTVREQSDVKMDLDNIPPILTLLREYSDKLCCMVGEEIRKKNVIKE